MTGYVFSNAAEDPTARRFAGLETLYDARTQRQLEATGIGAGWRCLEIGAGGGSIATWLADRVGSEGEVLATDLDPRFLERLNTTARPQLTVRRHDVVTDALPDAAFDLIHARLVLLHLPTAAAVLPRLVAALRPGGWLVIEDFDPTFVDRAFPVTDPAIAATMRRVFGPLGALIEARGASPGWARGLHARFTAAGLTDVAADCHLEIRAGGSPGARVDAANIEQAGPGLVEAGKAEASDVEHVLAHLRDPQVTYASPMMFSVQGRRAA